MTDKSDKKVERISKAGMSEPGRRSGREAWVARSLLSGYRQRDLVKLYKQEFGDTISASHVSLCVRTLVAKWKESSLVDTDTHVGRELERLDEMEYLAWENYRSCGGTIQHTDVRDSFSRVESGKQEGKMVKQQSIIVTKTKDDPRLAMQWFDRILRIQTDRRKVLRLEASVTVNNIMALKGYSVFNPGKDWPEQENLPMPNVIDLEFEKKRQADS